MFSLFKRRQLVVSANSAVDFGLVRVPQNNFTTKPGNDHLLDQELVANEKQLFDGNFDEKQKAALQMERLAMLELQKRSIDDQQAWWHKLKTMTDQEMKLMPYGFLKKYGSMLHFLRRMEKEAHVSENKEYRDYYT